MHQGRPAIRRDDIGRKTAKGCGISLRMNAVAKRRAPGEIDIPIRPSATLTGSPKLHYGEVRLGVVSAIMLAQREHQLVVTGALETAFDLFLPPQLQPRDRQPHGAGGFRRVVVDL